MANNQQRAFRKAVAKAKKTHEGNIVAVLTQYRGKVPQVQDQFQEHGRFAFAPDPESVKRKRERRAKAAAQRNKGTNYVTSLIG